jgi:hypothetical protein
MQSSYSCGPIQGSLLLSKPFLPDPLNQRHSHRDSITTSIVAEAMTAFQMVWLRAPNEELFHLSTSADFIVS